MRNKSTNYVVYTCWTTVTCYFIFSLLIRISTNNRYKVCWTKMRIRFFYDQPDFFLILNEGNKSETLRRLHCSWLRCIFHAISTIVELPYTCRTPTPFVLEQINNKNFKSSIACETLSSKWTFSSGRKRTHRKINWRSLIIFYILIGN